MSTTAVNMAFIWVSFAVFVPCFSFVYPSFLPSSSNNANLDYDTNLDYDLLRYSNRVTPDHHENSAAM